MTIGALSTFEDAETNKSREWTGSIHESLRTPAGSSSKIKSSQQWQDKLWQRWPREECWPAKMDVYEAAAYLRVSPDTIRRAVVVARDGKAKLAHQRLGSVYRFRKADLEAYGLVSARK